MIALLTVVRRNRQAGSAPDHGAVAVEFAFVLPILAMLLMGIVTAGLSYSRALGVTNAVREGARFGATADASLSSADWTGDVIKRVRQTQFDDPGPSGTPPGLYATRICVQLWKVGGAAVKEACSDPAEGGPSLSMPDPSAYPKVPDDAESGSCVVRVVAARKYTINAILVQFNNQTMIRGAVTRYERTC